MKKELIERIFPILLLAILILPIISALDLQEQGDLARQDLDKTADYAKSSFNFNSDIQLPDYVQNIARILFHLDEEEISLSALIILIVLFVWVLIISFNLFEISFSKNYAFLLSIILATIISYLGILSKITLFINWILGNLPIVGENTTFALLMRLFFIILIVLSIYLIKYPIKYIKNWLEIRRMGREGTKVANSKKQINSIIKTAKEIQKGFDEENEFGESAY